MWPLTAMGLQSLSVVALWVATIAGAIAVGAGFLSTVSANRASDLAQSEANRRIAEAEFRGRDALARAAEANAGVADAHAETAKANALAANANSRAAEANERAALAERQTEKLRNDNLVLEQIITPRHWVGPSVRGSTTLDGVFDMGLHRGAVESFHGMSAIIEVVPDFEALNLAAEIEQGLRKLGWSVTSNARPQNPFAISEGVQLWTRPKPSGGTAASQDPTSRAWFAAQALAVSLADEEITAESRSGPLHIDRVEGRYPPNDIRLSLPDGVVVILVGPKPATSELWQRETDRANSKPDTAPTKP